MNVYENSREDARELGETELWRESRRLNRACSDAITQAIREHFDGMYLDSGCEKPVIEQYGFARIMWVLAATMKYKEHDGRFSRENREWADTILPGWLSREEFADYICDSHPAVLDGFIREVRKAYDALGLLGKEQCLPDSYKQDFKEQLLIMKPKVLAEPFKRPEFQYFYATYGFGCDPGKLGTKVYGFFLKDHDPGEFRRSDFLGVADETKLPEWAEKRLSEIRAPHMQNDEGERISVSLTDAQTAQFSKDFRYPLIYLEHSGQDASEDESVDFSMT